MKLLYSTVQYIKYTGVQSNKVGTEQYNREVYATKQFIAVQYNKVK